MPAMTAGPSVVPDNVTVCITSCARLDLLERTLASFRKHHSGGRYLLSEDSGDAQVIATLRQRYPDMTVLTGTQPREGIMRSIDRLYREVQTPYICHLEDDWEFDGPVNWQAAIAMLESANKVANVSLRLFSEIRWGYRQRSRPAVLAGAKFAIMHRRAHFESFSWSPNPGLIKTELYRSYAPFARVQPDQMSGVMKKDGWVMAYLLPGVARHIGHGRNMPDPTMPARPKSRPAKWLRGFKKKLYYIGLRKEPF